MREIDEIIIHCSDTPANMDCGRDEIDRWHKANGWSGIGYHYVIRRDGTIEDGRDIEMIGAHALGHNANSIGVCLIGGKGGSGKTDCNFTAAQWGALRILVSHLTSQYQGARVIGHRDVAAKACPCFDVRSWWSAD